MKKIILLIFLLFLPSIALAPVWPIKTRASQVRTNTSNFDNILSSTTTTTQKALDIFDNVLISSATTDGLYVNLDGESVNITNGTFNLTTTGTGYFGTGITGASATGSAGLFERSGDGTTHPLLYLNAYGADTGVTLNIRNEGTGNSLVIHDGYSERFSITKTGVIGWWSHPYGAVDTSLYRGGANLLQTDDTFQGELIQGTTIYATSQFKCSDGTVFTSTSAFGGGGGSSTFLGLTDTPVAFETGKYFKSWTSSGTWETPAGAGDMTKAVYDTGANDIVDNSEALSGYAYTHFLDTTTADSTYLKKSEDDSSNYKLTLSSLAVTNNATVGSLSSSGQVTSNARKLIDTYDYAVCISTPNALGTIATLISPFRSYAVTISTISAQIIGGTNVVFMIEQRTIAGIESAGTDIWSGDVTALPDVWTGGTASDFTVPADSALVLVITSVSGNVDRFMFKYRGAKD